MWNNNNRDTTIQNNATVDDSCWKSVHNCVPLMLAHLNRYGEGLKIWGKPVRTITFLAVVDEVDVDGTRVNFRFHDETGSIRGTKWLDIEIPKLPIKVNSYARVYGSMRQQLNENFVFVLSIQPMEHLNELCAHLMEVTLLCLEAENSAIQVPTNTSVANYNSSVPAVSSINNGAYGNLSRDQILIMDIISGGHLEDGCERKVIKSQVPPHLTPLEVDAILEFLSAEGHIYTTKSDDHFKKIG